MIDLKDLRENPELYRTGATNKGVDINIDLVLSIDESLRAAQTRQQQLQAEKNGISKQIGPLMGQLKKTDDATKTTILQQIDALKNKSEALKEEEAILANSVRELESERLEHWMKIPQPADPDVPVGPDSSGNVEIKQWFPDSYNPAKTFEENKGFAPKTHVELIDTLGLADFPRGVKMAGSRSYVLTGDGFRLHQAVLTMAMDMMTQEFGFKAMSVPVLVREELMMGTGFFPGGKDQAYLVSEKDRGAGEDLYLTGTGEVGLMGYHQGEILEEEQLPICYTTVSTCFRREAGAAGRDTAGLYRIHQFDKVEQVVICKADETTSREWHQKMQGFVHTLLTRLELPHRYLQCCTGDLGIKNADMIDIECWMPGRGELDDNNVPTGDWGETHSASRLYDFQTRRLNLRYRSNVNGKKQVQHCHSLNNTVAASPRLLIPILEIHQTADGSVRIPEALQPYMAGQKTIQPH